MKNKIFFIFALLLSAQAHANTQQGYLAQKNTLPRQLPREVYPSPILSGGQLKYNNIIARTAQHYDLDPLLLHAMISVESGYQVDAISDKGAVGLMQVMPSTAARFGNFSLFLPDDNLTAGAAYLNMLMKRFNGQLDLVLASYNAGEDAVIHYGYSIPPYPETQQYVRKVIEYYSLLRQRVGMQFEKKMPLIIQEMPEEKQTSQATQGNKFSFRVATGSQGSSGVLRRFYSGLNEEKQSE